MSKFQKLFSLTENLYAEGAPLIISAGALQKNTENGSVFAQLKFRNITDKKIKAVRVTLSPKDDFGKALGETEFLYQDQSAGRDDEFGSKMPVVLADQSARSFDVKVTEVAFADGTKWNESGAEWKTVEKQDSVSSLLKDAQLIKQYHIKYGDSCDYIAKTDRDLVLCSCGAVNNADENSCHKCRNNLSALLSLDIAALTAEKDARLAKEAKAAEEKRIADEKAAEEAKKKAKRSAKIAGIVAACAAVIAASLVTIKVIIPTVKYNNAVELFNNKQYAEALEAFETLDGYKDSAELVVRSKYNKAIGLMNDEQYEEAISWFEQVKDYKDTKKIIVTCQDAIKYNSAMELMKNEQYEEAITAFEALDGYKDSAEQIKNCETACETTLKDIKYNNAVSLMNEEKYEEAIALFGSLSGYKDSNAQKTACETALETALKDIKYNNAVSLMNNGKYKEASDIFLTIFSYKDSSVKKVECDKILRGD